MGHSPEHVEAQELHWRMFYYAVADTLMWENAISNSGRPSKGDINTTSGGSSKKNLTVRDIKNMSGSK